MSERFNFWDAVHVQVDPQENSASITPGEHWNTLLNVVRNDEQQLESLGATVSVVAGTLTHSNMCESTATKFVRAAEPPMSFEEERVFRIGAMSQVPLMQVLDRAQGGKL